jgi:hypothetical protein
MVLIRVSIRPVWLQVRTIDNQVDYSYDIFASSLLLF